MAVIIPFRKRAAPETPLWPPQEMLLPNLEEPFKWLLSEEDTVLLPCDTEDAS